jgi:glycosyltransferase involved in cell wall biosynthesis
MPVHNALPHLDAAIESILGQSFSNFEFVILDDGSTDGSTRRLRQWSAEDARIRLIEVAHNLGPALSSQRVASAAWAPIVARMDADDISYPDRLQQQLEVLRVNPDAGLVACLCYFIDAAGKILREPEGWRLARRSVLAPFAHGAIMYRKRVFDRAGGYRRECEYWEDQDLVIRMALESPVLVIPQALYQVRLSSTSTRAASDQERLERAVDLMYRSVARLEANQGYDDLLRSGADDKAKINPRVFISLGSHVLWAGGRPRLFRRLLRRGKLSIDLRTFSALTWAAWASASPSTLRDFLRLLTAVRNRFAVATVPVDRPAAWRPPLNGVRFEIPAEDAEPLPIKRERGSSR